MSDRQADRGSRFRTVAMRIAVGGMSLSVTLYALAVGVNSQVSGNADWWPYPWLAGLAVLAGVSALLWLLLAFGASTPHDRTDSSGTDRLLGSDPSQGIPAYRAHLLADLKHRMGEYVELPVSIEGSVDDLATFEERLKQQTAIALVAKSGAGKTQLSRAVAIRALVDGRSVFWISFDEYERGKLDLLLARSVAPHTLLDPVALLKSSLEPLLIIDALDAGPAELREPFFRELLALRLRISFSLLVTSTQWSNELPDFPRATIEPPSAELRGSLRAAYRIPSDADLPDAFVTPLEIAIAGECLADLRPNTTPLELLGTYIRRRSPDETVRLGLWLIADLVTEQVRSALPVDTVRTALHQIPLRPLEIERVLSSPLLTITNERVRFSHDELGHYLAAESIVVASNSASELVARLGLPQNQDLVYRALKLEREEERRFEALLALANPTFLLLALEGQFGASAASSIAAGLDRVVNLAMSRLAEQHLQVVDDSQSVMWVSSQFWTESELAMLTACGALVARDGAVDQLLSLLDHMDAHLSLEMEKLREVGLRNPISLAVERTYANAWSDRPQSPGATIVVRALRHEGTSRLDALDHSHLVECLMKEAGLRSWGRLYVAALLVQQSRNVSACVAQVPKLIELGWRAQGYHLRLEVLMAAASVAHFVSGLARDAIVESLNSIDPPQHLLLSTQLVDTLALYGQINAGRTVEEVLIEIRETLSNPDAPQAPDRAAGAISGIFESQDIVGPYFEAIEMLEDNEQQLLFALALRSEHSAFHLSFIVGRLTEGPTLREPLAIAAVEMLAAETPPKSFMPQESVAGHLEALRGWIRISGNAWPPVRGDQQGTERDRAWYLFDQILIACLTRTTDDRYTSQFWDELIDERSAAGIRVLIEIQGASNILHSWAPHDLLLQTFESRVRALLEARLRPGAGMSDEREWIYDNPLLYVIRQLGKIGDESSAELLRPFRDDQDLGREAVAAIRSIDDRS